jgi:CubicO group peptidase (beta-lactamase class C family)
MRKNLLLGILVLTLLLGSCVQPAALPAIPATAAADPQTTPALVPTLLEHVTSSAGDFTDASPESQGISPEALRELGEIVSGYVRDDKVVGAELMVLKNRRIVLHEVFGWLDRDEGLTMPINTLFNIRSMTKPVVGMAIQVLADEGSLSLEDRVADYLPAFDNERSGDITIEHLLTHRSGLPMSMIVASFDEYDSLRMLADAAGELGPDFEPGSAFRYSDAGFDVLGALVEVVSGVPLQQFIQGHILAPLGMTETVTLVQAGDPRRDRIASLYYGTRGEWNRIWSPEEEPLYPFAMGSQSLYSNPLDYARFLALWMDEGSVGDERLLSPKAARRALTPVSDSGLPGGFPDLRLDYGQAWLIYVPEDAPEGDGQMALFGHSGSDGTWAWAWPDQDLMVLYFTQSRGQGTGIALEDEIDRLLIHPGREEIEVPEELKPYLGIYTALSGPLMYKEFEILVQDGRLAVNLPEQIVVPLEDPDEEGLWRLTLDPSLAVSFVQDEAGQVTALLWHAAGEVFELPRGRAPEEPPLDLEAVQKYLGEYERPEEGDTVQVIIYNEHLSVKTPEVAVALELYSPDEEGKWHFRLNPSVAISFQEDEEGNVISFTAHTPEGDYVRPRVN